MKIIPFEGGKDRNLSYIILNKKTKEALVVDPFKNIEIYIKKAEELRIKIVGVINTHLHIDHIEGNEHLKKIGYKVIKLNGKNKINLGDKIIKIIKTPGHSKDCRCFLINGNLLTGDVLLAKRVGMAFKEKDTPILYESLKKLKKLPKNTIIWPGHYYNSPYPFTLKEELKRNPYLNSKTYNEFKELMNYWREYMRIKREKIKYKNQLTNNNHKNRLKKG
ncbi:MAG: MBL fold metallo-hydrolase [Candidatus Pacearchaeota archaeon]